MASVPKKPATAAKTAPSAAVHHIAAIDAAVSLYLHSLFLPIPRLLLKTLEISGDGRFWIPIPIAILLSSASSASSASPIVTGLLVGFLLDLIVIGLTKHLVRRPRPVYNKNMGLTFAVDHWSFPSGHSSRVFFIAVYIWLCGEEVGRWTEDVMVVNWGIFGWAAVTATSRIVLGRHFVGDVVVGCLLGVLEAFAVAWLLKV